MMDETVKSSDERRPTMSRISWERFVTEAKELIDISQQLNDGWDWKMFDSVSTVENMEQNQDLDVSDIGRKANEREREIEREEGRLSLSKQRFQALV